MSEESLSVSRLSRSDSLVLQRLRAADPRAVAAIEKRYGPELRLFCRRMLNDASQAEDIVQDVLLTCCRLEAESLPAHSIRGWLYQVSRRRCIDALRKRREAEGPGARAARRGSHVPETAIDPLTTPSGKAIKRDRALRLLAVLDELDDDLRSVVVMRYFQELSRDQIAEAIGLSVAGTKARLSKAMQVLREKLSGLDDALP